MTLKYRRIMSSYKKATIAGNWWLSGSISAANCLIAYQPKGAASYAASLSNLANPGTYDATEGTAPDWDAVNGWKYTKTDSEYLKTGINPGENYSMIVKFTNGNIVDNNNIMGAHDNASDNRFYLSHSLLGKIYCSYGDTSAGSVNEVASGILCLAKDTGYLDAVAIYTNSGTWQVGGLPYEIYIGARNSSGAPNINYLTAYIQAVSIYNIELSSDQVSALTTAMESL